MRKVILNKKQSSFLIDHIKKSIDNTSMEEQLINPKEFIMLVQLHDILTGRYTPKENKMPDESLRGNDSCDTGICD
tara:strand:+ start:8729 stop:8956 length:228 start_codon:yes stop_codon:yes gene_type:complete